MDKKTTAELISTAAVMQGLCVMLEGKVGGIVNNLNGLGQNIRAIHEEVGQYADRMEQLQTALAQVTDTLERTLSGFQPEYEVCKAYIENANNLLHQKDLQPK